MRIPEGAKLIIPQSTLVQDNRTPWLRVNNGNLPTSDEYLDGFNDVEM